MQLQPELEALEAISQDAPTLDVCLRMAALTRNGGLEPFLAQLRDDCDLDHVTKAQVTELAADESFLLAVEDYARRTERLH